MSSMARPTRFLSRDIDTRAIDSGRMAILKNWRLSDGLITSLIWLSVWDLYLQVCFNINKTII